MNRASFIETVKELDLPEGEYVIVGSGLLVALDLREATDIDIAVTESLAQNLTDSGDYQEEIRYEKLFLHKGDIEIITTLHWAAQPVTVSEAIQHAVYYEGLPFMNHEHTILFKKAMGREKDHKDIELLREHFGRGTIE